MEVRTGGEIDKGKEGCSAVASLKVPSRSVTSHTLHLVLRSAEEVGRTTFKKKKRGLTCNSKCGPPLLYIMCNDTHAKAVLLS